MTVKFLFTKLAIVLIAATLLFVLSPSQATYRKPPFNGSIFGKRSGVTGGKYPRIYNVYKIYFIYS